VCDHVHIFLSLNFVEQYSDQKGGDAIKEAHLKTAPFCRQHYNR
jgi:hypothetical protein